MINSLQAPRPSLLAKAFRIGGYLFILGVTAYTFAKTTKVLSEEIER